LLKLSLIFNGSSFLVLRRLTVQRLAHRSLDPIQQSLGAFFKEVIKIVSAKRLGVDGVGPQDGSNNELGRPTLMTASVDPVTAGGWNRSLDVSEEGARLVGRA
jgi:hypothetical protein